jgi:hypothetical protein
MTESTFNTQVTERRDKDMAAKRTPGAGMAAGSAGRDHAALKHSAKLTIARRIARELAANGPISIDDVTERMVKDSYESDADVDTKARRFWKGKVFATSEWVPVDTVPSRRVSHHGRPITLWALKSWVKEGVNGLEYPKISAFHLVKIMADFQRANKDIPLQRCNWYIGMAKLAPEVLDSIKRGKYTMYQAPVQLIPGAVGAMLLPPTMQAPVLVPPAVAPAEAATNG